MTKQEAKRLAADLQRDIREEYGYRAAPTYSVVSRDDGSSTIKVKQRGGAYEYAQ